MKNNDKEVIEYQQKLIKDGVFADPSTIDWDGFVKYCEEEYGMKTDEFLIWYESEGEEGNSDMKMWASIARKKTD